MIVLVHIYTDLLQTQRMKMSCTVILQAVCYCLVATFHFLLIEELKYTTTQLF